VDRVVIETSSVTEKRLYKLEEEELKLVSS